VVDPHVTLDPVFQQLLQRHELAGRKLRDSIIALRSFHLSTHKSPADYDIGEKWRSAQLQEAAVHRLEDVRSAADDLLRYGFEIAPHSSCPKHLIMIGELKDAHQERLRSTGWADRPDPVRGIEEQVRVDNGPPITIVIKPKHYEFTEKHRKAQERKSSS
jgi:hypothetical protein